MSEKNKGLRATLLDVEPSIVVKFDKTQGIQTWGDNNNYPTQMRNLIAASVTARNCIKRNSAYIRGKGFAFELANEILVNQDGQTINQVLGDSSKELAYINNVFIHVNINSEYKITSAQIIPSTDSRVGKEDSKGYAGKFIVYNNWDLSIEESIKKGDFITIDRFNPDPKVIESQVQAAGGWQKYKGQILHIKGDASRIYAEADGDCVVFDMDSEKKAARFKNGGLRKGRFGARIYMTQPFDDDYERQAFQNTLKELEGEDSQESIIVMESNEMSDDFDTQFKMLDLSSNIDDKMFEFTENSVARNIRRAFGVPSILVETDSDAGIYGNSGELLKQAKLTHWEDLEEQRSLLINAFKRIFTRWVEPLEINDWSIIPIIQDKQATQ
ncbi:MAG: hypothetical protein EOO50_05280 [Flavobacterium sp.]|uniref:hypothetical protein n=1 Tax=Flavobacterium sp. TaxID=239 RepID=UPI00120B9EB6|nr:hypothetical protein [Flavobacterium sp.]RZJ67696.1 MAG: hypothetical protein EOO50_05280 [Flavobacterium sp.]